MDSDYARRYAELHARHWWWRARERHVLRWIRRLAAGRRLRILDIGCGDGFLWPALAPFGDVEGIEPDGYLVPGDSPNRPRIEHSTFPGRPRTERYDLILMLDVLEHIEDDVAALRAARELLVPGGHLLVTVPALRMLWSEFDDVNRHFRRYRRGELADRMRAADLAVVSARYYYVWPVLPLLARRFLFRARNAAESRFLRIPPRPVNAILEAVSAAEHAVTRVIPAPIGGSITAVARRPGDRAPSQ